MGGWSGIIKQAIKVVKDQTLTLQLDVTLERFTGDEKITEAKAGRRKYGSPVTYKAVVGYVTKFAAAEGGGAAGIQVSQIQFLEPLMITSRDRVTLPDGSHPQIVSVEGPLNYPGGEYFCPLVVF